MELGAWSLFDGPSLWGLLPLVIYVVLSFVISKDMVLPAGIAAVVGIIMAGNGPIGFGKAVINCLGGLMGQVGLIAMLASGLGAIMSDVGVSTTLCGWLIKAFHIKGKRSAIMVIAASIFLLSMFMGSGLQAATVCVTFGIPLAARFKISKTTMAAVNLFVGYAGMTMSPFSATNIAAMEITGLTFPEFLLWAAGPYVIVTAVGAVLMCLYEDKKYANAPDLQFYDDTGYAETTEPTQTQKVATIAFIVTFVLCVAYTVINNGGMAFTISYMIILSVVVAIFGKYNAHDAVASFFKRAGTMFTLMITLIMIQVILDSITAMGGFDALGNMVLGLIDGTDSQAAVMLLGTYFGAFGINGSAAAQMVVIDGVFREMVIATALPAAMWSMALLMGSLPSNFLFPGNVQWATMGVCHCTDFKRIMKMCWILTAIQLITATIYCLVIPVVF